MIWGWLKSFPEVLAQWPLKARCILVFLTGALCVPAMPPWCFWPVLAIGLPFILCRAFINTESQNRICRKLAVCIRLFRVRASVDRECLAGRWQSVFMGMAAGDCGPSGTAGPFLWHRRPYSQENGQDRQPFRVAGIRRDDQSDGMDARPYPDRISVEYVWLYMGWKSRHGAIRIPDRQLRTDITDNFLGHDPCPVVVSFRAKAHGYRYYRLGGTVGRFIGFVGDMPVWRHIRWICAAT